MSIIVGIVLASWVIGFAINLLSSKKGQGSAHILDIGTLSATSVIAVIILAFYTLGWIALLVIGVLWLLNYKRTW